MGTVVIAVAIVAFVVVAAFLVYASRVKKVGPNEVLVISGRGKGVNGFRIITGGRAFVWPVLERVDMLSLELMTIELTTPDVPTVQGVPVTVDGVAQIKIGSDENAIRTAAIQFLSKSKSEIEHVAHETLAGHLRAIQGTLTVEQLYRDRETFAQTVQEVSGDDMASMGVEIISFVIKDISDAEGYLDALGRPRIAQVKRDAQIGEAEAERDATIRSAEARERGEAAKYDAETKIAESQKKFEVEKAVYQQEINRKRAESELAYTLQENITNQAITAEQVQVQIIEKQKQIEVQEQETKRKERELDATVRKPAEAERHRLETLAEANKYRVQAEAEAEAAAILKRGQAEADVIRMRGAAEADAARALGVAQADVIREQGIAEAQATLQKADAWKEYTQAAVIQQLIDVLPAVADAIAKPLAQTERIVVVSTGSDNGSGAGASKITKDVTNMMAEMPATIEALTGIDLMGTISSLPGVKTVDGVKAEEKADVATTVENGSDQPVIIERTDQ
ncbi:MAG: SPFH domain-containing protein [Anaerolineae bacterium]|nr:SPFH domain-containing protein [Anaerolineae bacterium]MCO5193678.1 SPFH domain-containing protein [Anaerolineae bacterium]MCO5199740.1 SPFH domain-containing protein [Anaerolineae bacterium]MCO5206550.1 SPFH domain-containing protein [Anaerolineae bacterium]